MTHALVSLLRGLADCAARGLCTASGRFAVVVGIAVAIASSAHAAVAPFEVRVTGTGPDVLLIPGLASSGAVWDGTARALCANHRCHVFTLAGFAGLPAQPGPLLDRGDAALAEYVEQQHLKAPVVVGHSLGGFLALRLAIDHPADEPRAQVVAQHLGHRVDDGHAVGLAAPGLHARDVGRRDVARGPALHHAG